MLIGYARVSTQEQETHAQTDALRRAGCGTIYDEKRSGGNMQRPALHTMLDALQPGDVVMVYKLDRIARSLKDLLTIVDRIEAAGGKFASITEHIDTQSPTGRMIFQILGAFAEFERALIRERTMAGLAAAKSRGVITTRLPKLPAAKERQMVQLWHTGRYTKSELAIAYAVHISTVKRAIRRADPQLPLVDLAGDSDTLNQAQQQRLACI
ncbi:MAG: hypothetical protein JWN73_32 [Betaproteobacteria bacterium]|nr:hypothetical protein [Betaproteobacteria bacterium]